MAYVTAFIQTQAEDKQKPDIEIYTVDLSSIGFNRSDYYSKTVEFDPDKRYMIALDQSTSSTGIAVASEDFSHVVVFTVVCGSRGVYEKQRYIESLLEFLQRLMAGMSLIFWALEEVPPPYNGNIYTYRVLKELKSTIEARVSMFPAVQKIDKEMKFNPFPQQWKSTVYDKKEKGKKRFNNKVEIAKDITKIYPALQDYLKELQRTVGHDYDGFDAFGILTHIRLKCFNENWSRINNDKQSQSGLFFVCMKYIEDTIEVANDFVRNFSAWYEVIDDKGEIQNMVEPRHWSKDKSIMRNFIMAANSNKIICMECPNAKLLLSYIVETGEKYDKEKSLWLVVSKCNKILLPERYLNTLEKNGFLCKKYYRVHYHKKEEGRERKKNGIIEN